MSKLKKQKMCFSYVKSVVKSVRPMMGVLIMCVVCLAGLQDTQAVDDFGQGRTCGVEVSPHPLHRDPWVVFIEYRRGRLTDMRCAGALVSARHVLTAAHCLTTSWFTSIKARLGEYRISTRIDCEGGACADPPRSVGIKTALLHPKYIHDGDAHDIAVLVLEEDVSFTDYIRPVCLPTGALNTSIIFRAAGWGEVIHEGRFSDVKKSTPLPYFSKSNCKQAYKHSSIPHDTICAGGKKGFDTCPGDSGGPLMQTRDVVEIWGVTSLGSTSCGQEGKPAIFTSVVDNLDWIRSVMN